MARIGDGDGGTGETRIDVFVRGVLSGALVGAVIAGSTLWERRRRRAAALALEPVVPEAGSTDAVPAHDAAPAAGAGPSAGAAPPEG